MKIKSFKVRGYRTIKEEIEIDFKGSSITLVGPNNCGKTNVLRAIQLFFTGYENELGYSHARDLSRGQRSLQTSIQMTISDIDQTDDVDIFNLISQIASALKIQRSASDPLTLYLTFSNLSNPSYRVFPTTKRPTGAEGAAYSRLERRFFEAIFEKISLHYIPSEKSVPQIYETLIQPFLVREVYEVIREKTEEMSSALNTVANEVTATLVSAGLPSFKIGFDLPKDPLRLLGSVNFTIEDDNKTEATYKGMGIQSVSLLGVIDWISKKEASEKKIPLWLIEEPEAFLHPELVRQSESVVRMISKSGQVILTTHSLGFVPSDPSEVIGLTLMNGWSERHAFKTYNEATAHIRSSLGVKFSDFYHLSRNNIFVEGRTDRAYLKHIIDYISGRDQLANKFPILLSSDTTIHDFDGTKGLEGFLRATYAFISKEVNSVTLFDGDSAGDTARRALVGFFGNKAYPFRPNEHYVIVKDRFTIEGLAPIDFLNEINREHPKWLNAFGYDSQGELLPFTVNDDYKSSFFEAFKKYTGESPNENWTASWLKLINALEQALASQLN